MDYYSTLGLKRGASSDEIKKAYRSMAMKHHPDRGGDEKRFKEIEEAYRTLSDPEKKQMFDSGIDPNQSNFSGFRNQNPFEFHFGAHPGMDDVFNHFGFGFGGRPQRKNHSINVRVDLTLEEVLYGKDITAEVGLPNGKKKMINISIPAGIDHGQQIRYQGMGDSSIPDYRPGDLIVNINVMRHPRFQREMNNLFTDVKIPVWDAILGSSKHIQTLDGKTIDVKIPEGTQPDTVLSCKGEGLPDMRSKLRGDLLIRIKIEIPKNLTSEQKNKIKEINGNT